MSFHNIHLVVVYVVVVVAVGLGGVGGGVIVVVFFIQGQFARFTSNHRSYTIAIFIFISKEGLHFAGTIVVAKSMHNTKVLVILQIIAVANQQTPQVESKNVPNCKEF